MNGLRAVWVAGAAIVIAAVAFLMMDAPVGGPVPTIGAGAPAATPPERPSAAGDPAQDAQAPPPTGSAAAPPKAPPSAPPQPAPPAPAPRPPIAREPGAVDLGMDARIKEATVAAGNIVPRQDPKGGGPLLQADGRFEIRGSGTAESPYRVSWECLASAQDSYVPRLGEREIPQRIAMLHGKVVEVEGYLAFPLMVTESKELLVMLNQWDGCCIGVPPTPYDAIEVKLVEPAKRGGRHAMFNFGGVRGTLRVDPYLVDNWLVGLYILEDARMIEGKAPEL